MPTFPMPLGYFGLFGGQLIPPELKVVMDEIDAAYEEIRVCEDFRREFADLLADCMADRLGL